MFFGILRSRNQFEKDFVFLEKEKESECRELQHVSTKFAVRPVALFQQQRELPFRRVEKKNQGTSLPLVVDPRPGQGASPPGGARRAQLGAALERLPSNIDRAAVAGFQRRR